MVIYTLGLASAFPTLTEQASAIGRQIADLLQLMQRARTEGEKLKTETARLDQARTRLAALQETKRQSLSERQAKRQRARRGGKDRQNVEEQIDLLARLEREVSEREAGAKSGGRE